jgi:hypothetical protein
MGQVDSLRTLKECGCDVDAQKEEGLSPSYIAACNGNVEALKVLHELGANLMCAADDGAMSSHVAAHQGNKEVKF